MTEQQRNAINMAINTLNLVTVNGQANLSRLLGVIQLLGNVLNEEKGGNADDSGERV